LVQETVYPEKTTDLPQATLFLRNEI
jgi:hypothetical protein